MRAWKIKRARKKLTKWNEYIVSETSDLFGGPYKNMCGRTFKAECAESAIRRALKHWEREHHRFHDKGASAVYRLPLVNWDVSRLSTSRRTLRIISDNNI